MVSESPDGRSRCAGGYTSLASRPSPPEPPAGRRGGWASTGLANRPVRFFFLIVAPPLEVSNQYLPVLGKLAQFAKEPGITADPGARRPPPHRPPPPGARAPGGVPQKNGRRAPRPPAGLR